MAWPAENKGKNPMKLVLLSDIHGNAVALEAVLNDIEPEKFDRIVCLGDVATLGPQPVEVVDMLISLNPLCITGNHEEALLQPERSREFGIFPGIQADLDWCLIQLQARHFNFIKKFERSAEINENGHRAIFCHGSPRSSTEMMFPEMAKDTLSACLSGVASDIVVNGHLHCQFDKIASGRRLINPGSVGMPFKVNPGPGREPVMHGWAEYALLSFPSADGKGAADFELELRRVRYDFDKLRMAVESASLPGKAWWLRQADSFVDAVI